jgi:exosortase/archaeosortase family protein
MKGKYFFLRYLFKFVVTFCLFYFGTIALIGITTPGSYYSKYATDYLDYISLLRSGLLHSSKAFLSMFGYDTYLKDAFTLRLVNGWGVRIVYSCLGYGIMSFWIAFIIANKGNIAKKARWIIGGLALIFLINVLRISLMLIAIKEHWLSPFGLDNHTLFTIAAYTAIFTMIYFFDRAEKKQLAAIGK